MVSLSYIIIIINTKLFNIRRFDLDSLSFGNEKDMKMYKVVSYFNMNRDVCPDYLKHILAPLHKSSDGLKSIKLAIDECEKTLNELSFKFERERGALLSISKILSDIIKDEDIEKYASLYEKAQQKPPVEKANNIKTAVKENVDMAGRSFKKDG